MWILQLNDMRSSKIEISTTVVRAETKEELESFIERERVEGYHDDNWGKGFRKDGPLEWFNQPSNNHFEPYVDMGLWWQNNVMSIPEIPN